MIGQLRCRPAAIDQLKTLALKVGAILQASGGRIATTSR